MTAPPVSRDDLISRTAAAAQLGIHVNTLDREARRAGLRRFRVRGDNRVFFLRSEIDAQADPIIEIKGTAPAPGAAHEALTPAAGAATPTDTVRQVSA